MSLEGAQPLGEQTAPVPPQQATSPRSASTLLRFLGILVAISFLTSLYVWQASTISELDHQTAIINAQNAQLEQTTVELMLELAQWEGPSYIDKTTVVLGMEDGKPPIYVRQSPPEHSLEEALPELRLIWQEMSDLLPPSVRSTLATLQARQ